MPDCMGGVSSFNRNIINYAPKERDYRIKVILMRDEQDTRPKFEDEILADEIVVFKHSYFENQRLVFKRLSALLGEENGCIVTENALTMNVVRQMGTSKNIVYLVHDFYFATVALEYRNTLDSCIVHSSFFKDVLLSADMDVFNHKVNYLPYGVVPMNEPNKKIKKGKDLNLVFLGRLIPQKGPNLLYDIDMGLKSAGINVNWTVIGQGPLDSSLKEQWKNNNNIRFVAAKNTEEIYQLLEGSDVLVFPSKFEGTPVAIMEAMSRGVVPVASDLPGGTRDLITNETGFRCEVDNVKTFTEAISFLYHTPEALLQMQKNCLNKVASTYNIHKAALAYFGHFEKMISHGSQHNALPSLQFSKMDSRFLPNFLVYNIRKFKSRS
jgi:glycosyltransferase involved in cell wall biosynthesis